MAEEAEDFALLTKAQKQEIDEAAERAYAQVRIEQAKDRYARHARKLVRQKLSPDEKLCEVRILLPSSVTDACPWIQLDGTRYYTGYSYKVNRAVRSVIQDQIYRAWAQDAVSKGTRNEREYRQRMGLILSGSGTATGAFNVGRN